MRVLYIVILMLVCYGSYGQAPALKLEVRGLRIVARVTGASAAADSFPNTGQTPIYGVGGTDLGISWVLGNGQTGIFFGDTYGNDFKPVGGGPGQAGAWRNNVLAFTGDSCYADGLTLDSMAVSDTNKHFAREIIHRSRGAHTAIPTAAIHVGGAEYVHYFDLKSWEGWRTNFSSYYRSLDHGRSWQPCPEIRFPRGSKFSIAALAKKDGYVYMIGGSSLRQSRPFLCRFLEKNILFQDRYAYWNNERGWVKNEEAASTALFDETAGEASLFYHEELKTWIFVYLSEQARAIRLRTALAPNGPWSAPVEVADMRKYPGGYGPFVLPHQTGRDLYFTMSMWSPYNVFLMHAELTRL
ncbi:hypothetical protein GCM10027051_26450 [Niabella terrae]